MNMNQKVGNSGDTFVLKKTFDILDYRGGVYGFDVLNDNKKLLFHIDGEDEEVVIAEIKWRVYRQLL